MKVTIVGAGNVGATAANVIFAKNIAQDLILVDIKEGLAEGKVMDMLQTSHMLNITTRLLGCSNDYSKTANSDIIIITSGIARKPGMTREELIGINAKIVKSVMDDCLKYSPTAIFIIVSNPADTLTYLAIKNSNLPRNKVFGMSGVLDSNRFIYFLSQVLHCPPTDVNGMVIGVHGDLMVPLTRLATYEGTPVTELISPTTLAEIVHETKVGGGTLTSLLGTSAWYAPGAAVATMVEAIIKDTKQQLPVIAYLNSEYDETDVCSGVPAILGKNGLEKIIELKLTSEELSSFKESIKAIRTINATLAEAL